MSSTKNTSMWINVLLPLPVEQAYGYTVPIELQDKIDFGKRVEIQFGQKKLYTGLVIEIFHDIPSIPLKPIRDVLDQEPIFLEKHYRFWQWISQYYHCFLGEVMNAALPAPLKIDSETLFVYNDNHVVADEELSDESFLIAEAFEFSPELNWKDIQAILQKNNIKKHVIQLVESNIIHVKEKAIHKKAYNKELVMVWGENYRGNTAQALEDTQRSMKQSKAVLAFQTLIKQGEKSIKRAQIIERSGTDSATILALKKKGILEEVPYEKDFSQALKFSSKLPRLADFQEKAMEELRLAFQDFDVALLEGVTGSGKTRIYLEWVAEMAKQKKQVLLMLPEIALTTQIIIRLQQLFDSEVIVYHSKISEKSRMEAYYQVQQGATLVIGTRSSLFLPFPKLGMIIVDEEHDRSYKQSNPAPRFHGRDAAILLGKQQGAKVLLGTATPSIETWHNVQNNRYGHVEITKRFGYMALPVLQVLDLKTNMMNDAQKEIKMTPVLEQAIHDTLDSGRQVMIFQNRRGFAPMLQCVNCGYIERCNDCDVSMTYHKFHNKLQCHYCRKEKSIPKFCPTCKHWGMEIHGLGTEKIEEEIKAFFPNVNIDRLDYDTASGKKRLESILQRFMAKETQILVGTQMITKGLDFDHVGLVVIPHADQLLGFPDFRSSEWAFQILKQVSGRAGRKGDQGKVIIQTYQPEHDVYQHLLKGVNAGFYQSELIERKLFQYPPYTRLVKITFKNKDKGKNDKISYECYRYFLPYFDNRVHEPTPPVVSYVRSYHIMDIYIKLKKTAEDGRLFRQRINHFVKEVKGRPGYSNFRITVDIDPI
ncbi:replication restart helicase PriA [Membranihabitans marinus]|uniref:replication restart helicase PriA n=1 Tax=Membranihabitans marinus TaxID=1227546 RepID=UPI001F01ABE1|nr:primosomal protein N' [Membranihabitans marinus]